MAALGASWQPVPCSVLWACELLSCGMSSGDMSLGPASQQYVNPLAMTSTSLKECWCESLGHCFRWGSLPTHLGRQWKLARCQRPAPMWETKMKLPAIAWLNHGCCSHLEVNQGVEKPFLFLSNKYVSLYTRTRTHSSGDAQ